MGITILRTTASLPGPATPLDIATTADAGVSVRSAREDHMHRGLSAATPVDADITAAAVGAELLAARGDHRHKLADSGWIALPFVNGWTNYGGNYAPCGYRRLGSVVFLRGLTQSGTAALIFNLPVGYRPVIRHLFASYCNSNVPCRIDIDPNGNVELSGPYSNTWVAMNNLIFPTG